MGNSEVTLRVSPPGAGKLGQCCSGPYATGSPDSRLLLAGALDTGWDLGQRARLLGLDRSGWGALLLHGRRGRAAGAGTDSGHRSLQESLQARTRWGAQASVVTRWCVPDVREAGSGTFHKDFSAATCAQHQLEGGPTLVETVHSPRSTSLRGIYVAPEPVEAVLRQSPWVSELFVWGNGSMRSCAAVVVPKAQIDEGPGMAMDEDGVASVQDSQEFTRKCNP